MATKNKVARVYKAKEVADYFIYLASKNAVDEIDGKNIYEGITHLKLQKILYFAQAYFLVKINKSLFCDNIEAWKYGPVVPSVYHEYKDNANNPIIKSKDESTIFEEDKKNLQIVWSIFGRYSATELVNITHSQEPWREAYENSSDQVIHQNFIKEYYKGLFV